ncbi:GGDEF domain-containing protein [Deinococcus sp. Arct2-2]|uniref:GGDEF domain-containing protein n=1 Tax=Deinococcus sp. Arct2-2 TaxID=2568653 RepID=UPI0010A41E06|nr:tetratricopeptide repeat-containing diguanylate cyclase [Deinococcus sp. Arct2-2]THF69457.1 GGDEF domain-containing protein [Deinococcus sp. Arct2-2]
MPQLTPTPLPAAERAWANRELNPASARQWAQSQPPSPVRSVLLAYLNWRTGAYSEAFSQIDAALSELTAPDVWRSRALNTRAGLLMARLDFGAAHALYTEQLAVAQGCDNQLELAHAKHDLALTLIDLDSAKAVPLLQEALALFEQCGASEQAGVAHLNLGMVYQRRGQPSDAEQQYALAVQRGQDGYVVLHMLALSQLVVLNVQQSRIAAAEAYFEQLDQIPQSQDLEAEVERARASVLLTQELSRVRWAQDRGEQEEAERNPMDVHQPLDPATLALAMIGLANARQAQRLAELEASLAQAEAQHAAAERRSITDLLTGLHNRQHLMTEGARRLADGTASAPAQAAMIDVDRFKRVNDTHGHATGDAVLRDIAALLTSHALPCDLVARYGGEEFVLVRSAGQPGLVPTLEAFRLAVQDHAWTTRPVTVSIGLTLVPDDSLDTALDRADQLMYAAKRAGGNRLRHDLPRESGRTGPQVSSVYDPERDSVC